MKRKRQKFSEDDQEVVQTTSKKPTIRYGMSDLPFEVLAIIFEQTNPITQATLRQVCQLWKDVVDFSLDIIGKFNRMQDEIDFLDLEAKRNSKAEEIPEQKKKRTADRAALLKNKKTFFALAELLESDNQNYLIFNRERFSPFVRQAAVQHPQGLVVGIRYIFDDYPRVFHAFHKSFLQEICGISIDQEERANESPIWDDDLLFLLKPRGIDYLLENRTLFHKLAPFFLRALKNQAFFPQSLIDLSTVSPEAYEILLSSFQEFLATPEDLKNHFFFLADDPLAFCYHFPHLHGLITTSSECRTALKELAEEALFDIEDDEERDKTQVKSIVGSPYSTTAVQFKRHLAVHTLLKFCKEEEESLARSNYLLEILKTHIDGSEGWADVDEPENNRLLDAYLNEMGTRPLYGYPLWCAYDFEELSYWLRQIITYYGICSPQANLPLMHRFSRVANRNFKLVSEKFEKDQNTDEGQALSERYSRIFEAYSDRLDNLQDRLATTYRNLGDMRQTYWTYQEMKFHPSLRIVDTILDLHSYHFQFKKIVSFCNAYLHNPLCPSPTKTLFEVKSFDALLHLPPEVGDDEKTVKRLGEVLENLGEENILKTPIRSHMSSFLCVLSKEDICFLKTCFEVRMRARPFDDLLDQLHKHLPLTKDYFLRIKATKAAEEEGEKELEKKTTSMPWKVLYGQSVIARALEVLTHIGYSTLEEETKEALLKEIAPTFNILNSPKVLKKIRNHPWDAKVLKQSLLPYDTLLLKVFKRDQEVTRNYHEIRYLLDIDLREEMEEEELGAGKKQKRKAVFLNT